MWGKRYETSSFDGIRATHEPLEPLDMDAGRNTLMEEVEMSPMAYKYDIFDTLVCSHTQFDLLVELMLEKPYLERSKVYANHCVPHGTVYYVDFDGIATKFKMVSV